MDNPGHYDEYPELTRADMSWAAKPERSSADDHCKRVNIDEGMTTPSVPPIALAGEPIAYTLRHRMLLTKLQVGGCSCLTKTPEIQYHDENCQYRLATEIDDMLAAPSPSASSVPVAMPEGWRMRIEEGAAVVQKEGLGGVVVHADDNSIAAAILHALATDILAAPPASNESKE